MDVPASSVVDFYNRHPISEGQVVDALRRLGKDLQRLEPEDLYGLDQDHYGGLEAVEALERRARIDATSRVLDVCAGLAGPARFIARRWGARVTGIDLNPERATGARRLTARVGLGRLVRMVRADAQSLPFAPAALPPSSARKDSPRSRQGAGARRVRSRAAAGWPPRLQRLDRHARLSQRAVSPRAMDGRRDAAGH
jgi:SAM-dependent methyltransferase